MITAALQAEIERHLKRRVVSISPLSAANNAQIYRINMEDGASYVTKVAERGLDIEAYMLSYLKAKSKLPVPNVHYSNEHVIIMDFIESHHSLDEAGQRNAAELLAGLHQVHADSYGLERDTLVGSLRQPNTQNKNWADFFTQQRLLYMGWETFGENKIDKKMMNQIEKLAAKLPSYINSASLPSLIHGDIWSGNIIAGRGRIAAFLDPAIYYADPEIELSFIRLLNTFSSVFFTRYNEINPIRPGFEERADIYSLYPLLVHTRLFGSSYVRKVQRVLDKFT